ncbi:hypothetical protein [Mycobacterium spongiae]|uniref:Oxidoreductase n=1 Tax=Mycobacterium spongiae TaxID=886343 RepID=A0A975JY03_9MYCO|nr:hypothetical protein [Mycobacterium spongiae]QUR67458.1 hypothetical protein F6B93_10435 [Mycobacterium spongiae]
MTRSSVPGLLVSCEDWIARLKGAAASGQCVDLAPGEDLEPADGATWSPDRRVPAAALRAVLTCADLVVDSGGLRIRGARIIGALDLNHVVFRHPLYLIQCLLDETLCITGATILDLNLRGTHLPGIDMVRSEITGSMFAGDGFEAAGEIRASGAKIQGDLDVSGATLNNPEGCALNLDIAEIGGNLVAAGGFQANGEISALQAAIKGQLDLRGATLTNPNGCALILNGAEIGSSVFAGEAFEANGEIRAWDATIKGPLRLSGATVTNPNGCSLNLFGAEIGSSVYAGDGFEANGQFLAWAATIKGQLYLSGATLNNPNDCALSLSGAEIADNLLAGDGFEARGEINAMGARINGDFRLSGANLYNPNGVALNLKKAKLGVLTLAPESVQGPIVLNRAVIEDLVTASKDPPPVVATGWTLGDIHGPLRYDWRIAKKWLNAKSPSSTQPPRREQKGRAPVQPWYELADVYERNGGPAAARHLRFAAANKTTKQSPWPTKLVRRAYLLLAGNGYYPLIAALWLLLVVVAGWRLVATNREDILPAHEVVAAIQHQMGDRAPPITAETPCEKLSDLAKAENIKTLRAYPCMTSFAFAVNTILPAAGGVIESDWVVAPDATRALTLGLPMLKFTAWGLAALLLAAITGLLRKT